MLPRPRASTRYLALVLVVTLVAVACGNSTGGGDAGDADVLTSMDVTDDLAVDVAGDAAPLPPWPHTLPPARTLGDTRGWHAVRAIIHAHSVHSHDACDGNPYVDGGPNEPCLGHFRAAVCSARIDVVFLTEHAGLMADGTFERVLQTRMGDEEIRSGGSLIGYWIACANGHRAMILPGAENALMPIAQMRHPDPVGTSLREAYNADDPAAVARFRATGALVAIPHTESRTLDHLIALAPDMIEIYNTHANLDPRISVQDLDFNAGEFYLDLTRFSTDRTLEPDLVPLVFFRENNNDLGKWASLLSRGMHIPAIAGSDTHENVISVNLADGERGDSYRRFWRFFANMLMVRGELSRDTALDALRNGRSFIAFEAWGTPVGFEFAARPTAGPDGGAGSPNDIGDRVAAATQPALSVRRPSVYMLDPSLPRPDIRVRIMRAEGSNWREVATSSTGDLEFRATTAGVYRAEARITPHHAVPYVRRFAATVTRELTWIYSNPIYVE